MPLYHTTCDNCGDQQEEIRSMAEGPRKRCPKCKHAVHQEFGVPRLEVNNYSPLHPRKLRGKAGKRCKK